MDAKLGEILKAVDELHLRNSTAIVVHSDHGFVLLFAPFSHLSRNVIVHETCRWQLGEHCEWRKNTLFDLATRVPLMISVPWIPVRRPAIEVSETHDKISNLCLVLV